MYEKKYLILILLSLILFSCNNQKKQLEQKKELFYSVIKSEDLRMNVIEYVDKSILYTSRSFIIGIDYREKNDTIILDIEYNINLSALIHNPPIYNFEIDDNIVVVRSNIEELKSISSESLHSIMKKCFPEQYKEYKSTGMAIPATLSCNEYILKFLNDSLISKTVIPFIIEPIPHY